MNASNLFAEIPETAGEELCETLLAKYSPRIRQPGGAIASASGVAEARASLP